MLPDNAGSIYGWLGNGFLSTGDYGRARELHEQCRAICEALGDRAGVAGACANLGNCYFRTGDYGRARELHEQHRVMAETLPDQAKAALRVGVALRLEVRANMRGRAPGVSQLPGPHASVSACSDDGVREAEKWLQTALDLGHTAARLHLAQLAFDAGPEDTALAHLQDYLSWCVERGRNWCAGCYQTRGEDAQMLTCGGCRVARL